MKGLVNIFNHSDTQSSANEYIYIRIDGSNLQAVSAYVDDLGPFSNSEKGMVRVKRELNDNFPMTDFGGDGGDPWDQS